MADSSTLVFKGSDPLKVIFFSRLLYQLNFVSVLNTQHLVGALGWNLRSHDPGDRARNGSAGLSGDEARVVRYTQESLRHHNISDATFNAVRHRLGMQKTVERTGLMGHDLLVCQILAAFEVDLPKNVQPEIPL
jgi:hypothetical protein